MPHVWLTKPCPRRLPSTGNALKNDVVDRRRGGGAERRRGGAGSFAHRRPMADASAADPWRRIVAHTPSNPEIPCPAMPPISCPRALRARSFGGRAESQDRMDLIHHAGRVVGEALRGLAVDGPMCSPIPASIRAAAWCSVFEAASAARGPGRGALPALTMPRPPRKGLAPPRAGPSDLPPPPPLRPGAGRIRRVAWT
jgi:hypothetical protein